MRISDCNILINHSCSSFDHPIDYFLLKLPCTACIHYLYHCFCLIIAGHFIIAYLYLLAVVDGSLCLHVIIYFVYYLRCLLLGSEFNVGGSLGLHAISTISTCSLASHVSRTYLTLRHYGTKRAKRKQHGQ